jgi:hypothetical protein
MVSAATWHAGNSGSVSNESKTFRALERLARSTHWSAAWRLAEWAAALGGGGGGKRSNVKHIAGTAFSREPPATSPTDLDGDCARAAGLGMSALCPIGGDIMVRPVVLPDGHAYESQSIAEWVRFAGTSPLTSEAVSGDPATFRPCFALANLIADSLKRLGIDMADHYPQQDTEAHSHGPASSETMQEYELARNTIAVLLQHRQETALMDRASVEAVARKIIESRTDGVPGDPSEATVEGWMDAEVQALWDTVTGVEFSQTTPEQRRRITTMTIIVTHPATVPEIQHAAARMVLGGAEFPEVSAALSDIAQRHFLPHAVMHGMFVNVARVRPPPRPPAARISRRAPVPVNVSHGVSREPLAGMPATSLPASQPVPIEPRAPPEPLPPTHRWVQVSPGVRAMMVDPTTELPAESPPESPPAPRARVTVDVVGVDSGEDDIMFTDIVSVPSTDSGSPGTPSLVEQRPRINVEAWVDLALMTHPETGAAVVAVDGDEQFSIWCDMVREIMSARLVEWAGTGFDPAVRRDLVDAVYIMAANGLPT